MTHYRGSGTGNGGTALITVFLSSPRFHFPSSPNPEPDIVAAVRHSVACRILPTRSSSSFYFLLANFYKNKVIYSDDHDGKTQTRGRETDSTDPGPQNTLCVDFQIRVYMMTLSSLHRQLSAKACLSRLT